MEQKYGKPYGKHSPCAQNNSRESSSTIALSRECSVQLSMALPADLSIVRRHIPGKMLVALNVMWTHLGQQSFPMSEEEYMDKLDTIAYYLR